MHVLDFRTEGGPWPHDSERSVGVFPQFFFSSFSAVFRVSSCRFGVFPQFLVVLALVDLVSFLSFFSRRFRLVANFGLGCQSPCP